MPVRIPVMALGYAKAPSCFVALGILALLQRGRTVATYPSEFRFSWCVGDQCFDHSVSAAHFQLRISRHYAEGSRPPVREAFFVVTLPLQFSRELLLGCPGVVVLSHLLVAELRLYTHHAEEAEELIARAKAMMELPELVPHLEGLNRAWPVAAAFDRYQAVAQRMRETGPMSLDIVLPRCREDLSWLSDAGKIEMIPRQTRIFVYEKCGGQIAENLSIHLPPWIHIVDTVLDDAADPRTGLAARRDECTAYLAHVVRQYGSDEPGVGGFADMTFFLHGDPGDHTPFGFLNLALRGLVAGSLRDVEFLHLGAPRMVYTSNPCQEGIFEVAIGRPQRRPLSTYCCAQFAVSRSRILSRPLHDYVRMLRLVDGTTPDICERIGPAYEKYVGQRLSHCFFFEFMWHVVFGEAEELPLRADDERLPPFLRLRDNEESLPGIWHSYLNPYVGGQVSFARQNHAEWLSQMGRPTSLGQPKQVNYGDLVQGL